MTQKIYYISKNAALSLGMVEGLPIIELSSKLTNRWLVHCGTTYENFSPTKEVNLEKLIS